MHLSWLFHSENDTIYFQFYMYVYGVFISPLYGYIIKTEMWETYNNVVCIKSKSA